MPDVNTQVGVFNVVNNVNVSINIGDALNALVRTLKDWLAPRDRKYDKELISSCRGQDLQSVQTLLSKKIDINARDEEGRTLLIIASTIGDNDSVGEENFQLVKLLLECDPKPDINAKDNKGNTALIMASRNGAKRIVQALIDAGADVNAQNKKGWTGLMRASKHGYIETARLLMEKRADKDLRNQEGKKAQDVVIKQIEDIEKHLAVLRRLEKMLS